jgi:hypothetical protein
LSPASQQQPQLACLKSHCSCLLANNADLEAHCQLEHGMALVEIADAVYERNALQGGVFWLGGIEPGHEPFFAAVEKGAAGYPEEPDEPLEGCELGDSDMETQDFCGTQLFNFADWDEYMNINSKPES